MYICKNICTHTHIDTCIYAYIFIWCQGTLLFIFLIFRFYLFILIFIYFFHSDPVGPAEALFKPEFFLSMKNALAPNGVICTQGECLWLHLDLISNVINQCKDIFPSVKYAYTTIPTYPSGQIGFIIASTDASMDIAIPSRTIPSVMNLQYYSENIHKSAFVLPGTYICVHRCIQLTVMLVVIFISSIFVFLFHCLSSISDYYWFTLILCFILILYFFSYE